MVTGPVLAVDRYLTNGHLVEAAGRLGHLRREWLTLDCTYGLGTWWSVWAPDVLAKSDLFPLSADVARADFTSMPWGPDHFQAVTFDPPYKLNGRATPDVDGRYGVGEYASAAARHQLMRDGLTECARVLRPAVRVDGDWVGGRLLVKCMDQVNGGRMHWQTVMMTNHAATLGLTLVERLDKSGGRPQPDRNRRRCRACGKQNVKVLHRCEFVPAWSVAHPGPWLEDYPSPQQHAYMRPSSLLVFRKDP